MRMVFKELRGSFVRFRANDGVGPHVVAHILDTALSNIFCLAEGATHPSNRVAMFFDPGGCGQKVMFI
jgi:hypothetical protein